jgi:murein DD-endopeptidase MepM/ murein hydrolase activator NlpD
MSRGFGMHTDPFTGLYESHQGMDLAAPKGTPVRATADGIVTGAEFQSGLGNMILIDHGNGITTCYGHLSKIMVTRGRQVKRGDVIGQVGSTGYSTGPHLHYEVRDHDRPLNPANYIIKSILSLS